MLTTIKVFAYYTAKLTKQAKKSPGSAFALSASGSWYSDAVLVAAEL